MEDHQDNQNNAPMSLHIDLTVDQPTPPGNSERHPVEEQKEHQTAAIKQEAPLTRANSQ